MHVVIINGSPRVQKYSNTDKIIAAFAKGLSEKGNTFETYAISNRKTWDVIRDAFIKNDEILIALPLNEEWVQAFLSFAERLRGGVPASLRRGVSGKIAGISGCSLWRLPGEGR